MKRINILPILALLAAIAGCGGGEVVCSTAGACTVNTGTISAPGVSSPSAAASVPVAAPAASAPAAPVVAVPLARMQAQLPPRASPGALYWTAGGMTYLVAVVTNGDLVWCSLFSAPTIGASVSMTLQEVSLDNALDLKPPASSGDADIRAWMVAKVLPGLNAWYAINSGRLANGLTAAPVSTDAVPAGWSVYDRAGGLLAQWVRLTPAGFVVAP